MTKGGRLHERGFTLLEVVVGVTLLGLVALGFAFLSTNAQRYLIQSMGASASQGEATIALEHIKRHLTAATAVAQPPVANPPANQTAILEFTWQPRADQAVRTSRYELNNNNLRFIPDVASAGVFEVVARGVKNLTFTRNNAGRVTVDVMADQIVPDGDVRQMYLQTVISPRGIF